MYIQNNENNWVKEIIDKMAYLDASDYIYNFSDSDPTVDRMLQVGSQHEEEFDFEYL